MTDSYDPPGRVVGVDFSADRKRAGRKIWIAEGVVENDRLRVTECRQVADRFDVSPGRDRSLPAVTRFLASLPSETAVGVDAPFGLPEDVVAADDWPAFVREFPDWVQDPVDFRNRCRARASLHDGDDGTEVRRETEEPLGALCPYDIRLRAQTFYWIRDVLRPLVLTADVSVLPMQSLGRDRPTLLEVYPAGTLDRLDAHETKYKADSEEARTRRRENLDELVAAGVSLDDGVRAVAIEEANGDALDAVVAAVATYQNTVDPTNLQTDDPTRSLEGHIYV